MSEAQLRKVETRMLGPAHAREHAMMRRALREEQAGTAKSAAQPSAEPKLAAAAEAQVDGAP